MRKLMTGIALGVSLLTTSPVFAQEVKSGDTLGEIASENGMTLDQIVSMNPQIKNPNLIFVGQQVNTVLTKTEKKHTVKAKAESVSGVSSYEKDLLARLVRAEAESEPYSGKVAVAKVVLNRVHDPEFPNTISGVINQGGQFSPVSNGMINRPADSESIKAVNDALAGGGRSDSLYFYNPNTASSHWLDGRQTTAVIGSHVFKK